MDISKAKQFVASISEEDLDGDEVLNRSNEFFSQNFSQEDAEFANSMVSSTAVDFEQIEVYAYRGAPSAQLFVGTLKLTGDGVEQNIPEAIFWLRRYLIGRNPKSGLILADVYTRGIGVSENPIQARAYLKKAADFRVPQAQYHYAIMLLDGFGGPVDEELAVEHMFSASRREFADATDFLKMNELL